MKLRDYQALASETLSRTKRGIVVVPAGGGKTVIAAASIIRAINARHAVGNEAKPVIRWIAATRDQCGQAWAALEAFELCNVATIEVGCPGKAWEHSNPDLAVIDECHHVPADSWEVALSDCHKARWGFTATPFRNDEKTADIFRIIGPVVFEVGQDALREIGAIVPGVVRFLTILPDESAAKITQAAEREFLQASARFRKCDPKELKNRITFKFAKKYGIEEHPERNRAVVERASEKAGPTLLLVGSIEHGKALQKQIPESVLMHSKSAGRKRIVEDFRAGKIPVLIATSLADEGFDAPCASRLILAAGGRAANRVEQRAGRVLRPFPGKEEGEIIDFEDNQHFFLRAQSRARRKVYEKLGYRIA